MDLFSITCTTCKSRLKVREPAAIGQILACPKCGGMVMVKPPDGWEPGRPPGARAPDPPPGVTAVVSLHNPDETASSANFDAVDDVLADAPPRSKTTTVTVAEGAPGLARPRFAGAPMPLKPEAPSTDAHNGEGPADADFPGETNGRSSGWYWVALTGSIAAGIALAIAVVIASIKFFSGSGQQVVQNVVAPQPVSTAPSTTPPADPADSQTPPAPIPVDPAEGAQETSPPGSTTVEQATAPSDPVRDSTDPPVLANAPTPQSPFDSLLEPEKDPLQAPEVAAPATPASPVEPADDAPPPKPAMPRPEPREIDLAARLADPLAALETDATPLADFLQVLSDLSTIPITLEPDALPIVQGSATSPIAVKLTNTTVGDALKAGLARLRLEYVPVENGLVVRVAEPAEMAVQAYPIKDLSGGDEAAAAELAEMIQALVDPPSWKQGDAGAAIEVAADALKIKQRRAVQAQIFLLCEKLRTARKLPYASRFPAALFQLASRTQQAAPKLKTPVAVNYHQPTAVVKILARLQEIAGVRILVDWQDIAAAGWNSAGEATLIADEGTLALALEKLLGPMDLAWRIVDAQTIQVVTPATMNSRSELEFYKVDDLVKKDPAAEELIARVRSELGESLFLDQGGTCEVRFDPLGQCLIASLPQPKQQDLEALLIALRATER
jgi:DNA-directed RNA polymerase subunit RPC12/RpoP